MDVVYQVSCKLYAIVIMVHRSNNVIDTSLENIRYWSGGELIYFVIM